MGPPGGTTRPAKRRLETYQFFGFLLELPGEKLGLDGADGPRILGNYQKCEYHLAARDLPPGASAVAMLLRGCDDMRWVRFYFSFIGFCEN
ncbi:hypothetical protein DEO72_LG1g2152 [Vigna unguiculata]|uniref:Uncharacterized protein n=1 Tax=Vigna unguiculata TaxID=3917 RepID=A0A4D6KS19_VIGUN|nr:hypothetical protein DEO72_LG1g2152 [Vigna unguiculata]